MHVARPQQCEVQPTNVLRMGFYERWMEKILRSSRRSVSQRTWRCDKNGLTYRLPVPSPFLIKHTCPDSVYARAARLKVFVMRKSSLNKYATRTIAVSLPRRWAIIAISRTIRTGRLGQFARQVRGYSVSTIISKTRGPEAEGCAKSGNVRESGRNISRER